MSEERVGKFFGEVFANWDTDAIPMDSAHIQSLVRIDNPETFKARMEEYGYKSEEIDEKLEYYAGRLAERLEIKYDYSISIDRFVEAIKHLEKAHFLSEPLTVFYHERDIPIVVSDYYNAFVLAPRFYDE